MTFLLYLCKVFLGSGILLGYYWFFLRNKRFHRYNRFYLLGAFVLPICLSFIRIGVSIEPQNVMDEAVYRTITVLTVNYGETDGQLSAAAEPSDLFKMEYLLYLVYAAGILALLIVLSRSLLHISRIARKYRHEVVGGMKFYNTSEPGTPFSFFKSVFWNKQLEFNTREGQQIFRHELFHVQQRHSVDILLVELITALFWWNPFFHMAKKELKAIHEFLADEYAVSGNDRYSYAELLVLQVMRSGNTAVAHPFFNNHIKRRIAMITHLTNARKSYWSRLMALPIIVFLFCGIALYAQQPTAAAGSRFDKDNDKELINVVIDAGHGGIDPGASSWDGKVKEKDLALQISQQIQALAPSYNVKVIMTRTKDELPANNTEIIEGLRARTQITEQAKADAFVSIHVAAAGTDSNTAANKGGFEVFIPSENRNNNQGSQQLGSAILQSLSPFYTTKETLLQRKQKSIWVLNSAPCPAVLIECGYITNKKDLAFMSNSDNQQAIARKILEGLVIYKKQLTTKNTHEERAPGQTTQTGKTSQRIFAQPPVINTTDSFTIAQKLSRLFNRNSRYPEKARTNNATGSVYFSVDVNTNGEIENVRLYQASPATNKKIYELVTVTFQSNDANAPAGISAEESRKIFKEEVERTIKRMPPVTEVVIKETATYYFKASFLIEKSKPS